MVNSISLDTNKYKEMLSSSNLAKKEIREIIKKIHRTNLEHHITIKEKYKKISV